MKISDVELFFWRSKEKVDFINWLVEEGFDWLTITDDSAVDGIERSCEEVVTGTDDVISMIFMVSFGDRFWVGHEGSINRINLGEVSRASNNGSVSFRFDSSRVQIDVANLIKFFKDLVLHEDDVRLAYFW